jgi:hypothetical protein
MLPDIALLEIFDFYLDKSSIEAWYTLAHVCGQWRNIVSVSPRRLNLRLCYKNSIPVMEMLDIWPLFPISIRVYRDEMWDLPMDNIITAVEHNDRVCELALYDFTSSQSEEVIAAMQRPFPALTCLELRPRDETAPVVPASFLGGSAPRLQKLFLDYILFPGLPKLLSSATQLVHLEFRNFPHAGYISPEAMVTCLSVLTRLERLDIEFKYSQSLPDPKSQRPPPPTRTLLPVLTEMWFGGVSEYFEDIAARIDAPLLDKLTITYHEATFDTPQLTQFISRTPKLKAYDEAHGPLSLTRWGHFDHLSTGI